MVTSIGSTIKKYRKAAKFTQKQLAEKLDKAESTIRMWELEKSTPSLSTMKKISSTLNIPLNELLFAELKAKLTQYTNEIMEYEIKEMQSQKYKELYDPAFKQETIEFLLNRYNFEGLSDSGIKQYTKEILDKYLDKVIYERKYKPHCNESAIDFVSDKLNAVLKEHLNNYFIDESAAENHFQHLQSDEIKDNLSYEVYTRISEIISTAQNEINDLRKSL